MKQIFPSRTLHTLAAVAVAATLAACTSLAPKPAPVTSSSNTITSSARLVATTGNTTNGIVRFVQTGTTVRITGGISGLKPGAIHGFHIHEKGDCSSGDGMSAGGHFNPTGAPHGNHGHGTHHTGDLPSLTANAFGIATLNFESNSIRLDGPNDITGRGLIVHRDPDDYTTQPTGNSGPRLACAVITGN